MLNFEQWFFSLFAILDEEKMEQAAAIIWSLWNQNNDKLWHNKMVTVSGAIKRGIDFLNWYKIARVRWNGSFVNHSLVSWWEKPALEQLKCNIDTMFFRTSL